jgi:hypothetical protein
MRNRTNSIDGSPDCYGDVSLRGLAREAEKMEEGSDSQADVLTLVNLADAQKRLDKPIDEVKEHIRDVLINHGLCA